MTEKGVIQVIEHIPHAPSKVWAALTTPELHAKWWAAGDVKPVVGHRFTLDMGQWGQQPCQILAAEPERLLSYTFAPGTLDTVITWRLEAEGEGTRLSFEQRGFDLESPMGKMAYEGMGGGWPGIVKSIGRVLSGA